MLSQEKALEAVFTAIDELNAQMPSDMQLQKSPDMPLTGDNSPLDSLGLINLIVALEEVIARGEGSAPQLLDEELLGEAEGPYSTPADLADYVAKAA